MKRESSPVVYDTNPLEEFNRAGLIKRMNQYILRHIKSEVSQSMSHKIA